MRYTATASATTDRRNHAIAGSRSAAADARQRIAAVLATPELQRPVFQPLFSLVSGSVVGYEAFSRFVAQPLRSPDRWFAEANRVGLGPDLQALAIARAIRAANDAGLPERTFLSLNVSPRHLAHPAVVAAFAAADPTTLVIEITEDEPVDDYVALRRAMQPYLAQGIRFAVDDAGAGFASMRHVTELEPAFVKLDADIVRGMHSHATIQAFIRALDRFAGEIGATVVAEGIERHDDLEVLALTGLPLLAQGFAIARPGPAWPSLDDAALETWARTTRQMRTAGHGVRARQASPPSELRSSAGEPVDHGVNVGVVLAAGLRGAGIDTLEELKALGAAAAWHRLRLAEPALATERTLLALEGAIRGVRWSALPEVDRQTLQEAVAQGALWSETQRS